jgi:hypothetical protein
MRRSQRERGGYKMLNENLAPLRRFLERQIGRPWDKVYSEIAERLRVDSTVQQHVREHLRDFVATRPRRGICAWYMKQYQRNSPEIEMEVNVRRLISPAVLDLVTGRSIPVGPEIDEEAAWLRIPAQLLGSALRNQQTTAAEENAAAAPSRERGERSWPVPGKRY